MPTTFETARLIIRPLHLKDLDDLWQLIYADEEVRRYFTGICTREEAERRLLEKVQFNIHPDNNGFGYWAVMRRTDSAFLGQLLLGPPEPMPWIVLADESTALPLGDEVELGYAFGRIYWSQGYATEACRAVINYAFTELKLRRLVNSVLRKNQPSIKLMQRLGFHVEANLPPAYDSVVGILNNPSPPPKM